MSDEIPEGTPSGGQGQPEPDSGSAAGTSVQTPSDGQGQAQAGSTGTTPADSGTPGGEAFFDHKAWQETLSGLPQDQSKPLEAAYKQMQGAFTKRMTSLAGDAKKLQAYDAFMADPVAQMRELAGRNGMQLVPNNGQPNGSQDQGVEEGNQWEPSTWDDVFSRVEDRIMGKLQSSFKPIMDRVQNLTTQSIEQKLAEIDGNWQVHEDDMKANLKAHPTLVNDVGMLYRMSVPEDVQNSRAVQAALKKLEDKGRAAQAGDKSTSVRSQPAPQKIDSFDAAVSAAKSQLGMK